MRPRGTGSIFREGKRWAAMLPGDMGRGRIGSFATRALAEAELAVEIEMIAGGCTTVAGWGDEWLRARRDRGDIQTGHQDLTTWRKLVVGSTLGDLPLAEVEGHDVRQWLSGLRREDGRRYVSTSLSCYLSILRKVLDAACDAGDLRTNPCIGIRVRNRGRKPTKGKERYSAEQVDELLALAPRVLDDHEATAVIIIACTGMRIADLRRLTWAQVDLDAAEIDIAQSKSDAGERLAPLFPPALAALRRWRLANPGDGPVFVSARGVIHGRGWRPGVRGLKGHLSWRYTPGSLRGTVGSLLLTGAWVERGWLPRPLRMEEVQWWLGHESPTVTARHYARLTRDHGVRALHLHGERSGKAQAPEIASLSGATDFEFGNQTGQIAERLRELACRYLADADEACRLTESRDPFAVTALVDTTPVGRALALEVLALMAEPRGAEVEHG